MLERLYSKYSYLCSFVHGLAHANLFKNVFDPRSPHRHVAPESQLEESFQYDVLGEAYTLNFLSIAQSTAELTCLYPNDMDLPTAALKAWDSLSQASLLTKSDMGDSDQIPVGRHLITIAACLQLASRAIRKPPN